MSYFFHWATTPAEFDGIRRLNHRTFAEELGQHDPQPAGVLIDPFEARSRYLVALFHGEVAGMVAVHDQPPWSAAKRLPDPAVLATLDGRILEVRLLAIDPPHRTTMLLAGLLGTLVEVALAEQYDFLLISGVVERLPFYLKLGFTPLGPAVPDGRAAFVPMLLRLAELPRRILTDIARWKKR